MSKRIEEDWRELYLEAKEGGASDREAEDYANEHTDTNNYESWPLHWF